MSKSTINSSKLTPRDTLNDKRDKKHTLSSTTDKKHLLCYDDFLSRTLGKVLPNCLSQVNHTLPDDPIETIARMLIRAADDQEYIKMRLKYLYRIERAKVEEENKMKKLGRSRWEVLPIQIQTGKSACLPNVEERQHDIKATIVKGKELYAKVLTEERNTLNWITGPGRQLITDVRKYTFIEGQTADNQSAASTRQELKVEKEADAFAGAMLKTEKKRLTKVKGLLKGEMLEQYLDQQKQDLLSKTTYKKMSARLKTAHRNARENMGKVVVPSVVPPPHNDSVLTRGSVDPSKRSRKASRYEDDTSASLSSDLSGISIPDSEMNPETPPAEVEEWRPWSSDASSSAEECPSDLRLERSQAKREVQRALERGNFMVTSKGLEVFTSGKLETMGCRPPDCTPRFPKLVLESPGEWHSRGFLCEALLDQELYTDCDAMKAYEVKAKVATPMDDNERGQNADQDTHQATILETVQDTDEDDDDPPFKHESVYDLILPKITPLSIFPNSNDASLESLQNDMENTNKNSPPNSINASLESLENEMENINRNSMQKEARIYSQKKRKSSKSNVRTKDSLMKDENRHHSALSITKLSPPSTHKKRERSIIYPTIITQEAVSSAQSIQNKVMPNTSTNAALTLVPKVTKKITKQRRKSSKLKPKAAGCASIIENQTNISPDSISTSTSSDSFSTITKDQTVFHILNKVVRTRKLQAITSSSYLSREVTESEITKNRQKNTQTFSDSSLSNLQTDVQTNESSDSLKTHTDQTDDSTTNTDQTDDSTLQKKKKRTRTACRSRKSVILPEIKSTQCFQIKKS